MMGLFFLIQILCALFAGDAVARMDHACPLRALWKLPAKFCVKGCLSVMLSNAASVNGFSYVR